MRRRELGERGEDGSEEDKEAVEMVSELTTDKGRFCNEISTLLITESSQIRSDLSRRELSQGS